jgi:hypothetical protein
MSVVLSAAAFSMMTSSGLPLSTVHLTLTLEKLLAIAFRYCSLLHFDFSDDRV